MMDDDFDGTIDIGLDELDQVCGGAITKAQWAEAKKEAAPYCPSTVKQYSHYTAGHITKPLAQQIAQSCVGEMYFWQRPAGQAKFDALINQAFPGK